MGCIEDASLLDYSGLFQVGKITIPWWMGCVTFLRKEGELKGYITPDGWDVRHFEQSIRARGGVSEGLHWS